MIYLDKNAFILWNKILAKRIMDLIWLLAAEMS